MTYDPPKLTKWQAFWRSSWGKGIAAVLFFAATVLALECSLAFPALAGGVWASYGAAFGLTAVTLGVGAGIAGYRSARQGKGFWNGFAEHVHNNWSQEVAITSAIFIVSLGITTAKFAVENAVSKKALEKYLFKSEQNKIVRVGRWMSEDEFLKIRSGNLVDTYGGGGAIHVSYPASYNAFGKQAVSGSIYVEFDIPIYSIKNAGNGWARILGPHSIESRLLISKGLVPLQYPQISNIVKVGFKNGNIIELF